MKNQKETKNQKKNKAKTRALEILLDEMTIKRPAVNARSLVDGVGYVHYKTTKFWRDYFKDRDLSKLTEFEDCFVECVINGLPPHLAIRRAAPFLNKKKEPELYKFHKQKKYSSFVNFISVFIALPEIRSRIDEGFKQTPQVITKEWALTRLLSMHEQYLLEGKDNEAIRTLNMLVNISGIADTQSRDFISGNTKIKIDYIQPPTEDTDYTEINE